MRLIDADALKKSLLAKFERFLDMCEVIDEQPSIEPMVVNDHRWIPVSERLPNEKDSVIFTDIYGKVLGGNYFKGAWHTRSNWYNDDEVTAWMPLPDPYKVGDNDD